MVMVVMDTRRQGVQVPPRFADDFQLRLNFSHKFYIDDFEYDEYGVRASFRSIRCLTIATFRGTRCTP